MQNICKRDLTDVLSHLPEVLPYNPTVDKESKSAELFLCVLGFEPRSLVLPELLGRAGFKAHRAVYLQYATNKNDNEINLPLLEEHLTAISLSVSSLREESTDFDREFRELITNLSCDRNVARARVTFDISGAANRLILKSLIPLLESDIDLTVIYSEASTYHPTEDEYEVSLEQWKSDETLGLERGVSRVLFSSDHPGNHLDPLPDCIIIFPTFKAERSWAAINKVDPSLITAPREKVIWLVGEPHHQGDRWRKQAMISINRITPQMKQCDVSTFDYKEVIQKLETIYEGIWECCNVSLLPLGSKLQAVGTSIFCYMHPDIRLVYAVPKEYNALQYSDGCKATWKIDFGSTTELRKVLDSVGELFIRKT